MSGILVKRYLDGVQITFDSGTLQSIVCMDFKLAKSLAENLMRAFNERPTRKPKTRKAVQ